MAAPIWKHFKCQKTQLCLDTVLICGQSFRWKKNTAGEWMGVVAGLVWRLKQTEDCIFYQVFGPLDSSRAPASSDAKYEDSKAVKEYNHFGNSENTAKLLSQPVAAGKGSKSEEFLSCELKVAADGRNAQSSRKHFLQTSCKRLHHVEDGKAKRIKKLENDLTKHNCCSATSEVLDEKSFHKTTDDKHFSVLQDYFQLSINLDELYRHWSARDSHFQQVAGNFHGIRILRQDPVENLISFVCSSNNHISRISSMVEKLCTHYGNFITTVDGIDFYSFPSLSSLCGDDVESNLRQLGFGYRAKFIASIAKHIVYEKEEGWLESLRKRSYTDSKAELMTLLGVGAKVADCVCLMSLDKPGAVPVDTHVWQITMKNYMAKLQSAKSLTERLYNEIGDFYRSLWGPYAGWAHSVLFTADLRHNKDKSVDKFKTGTVGKRNAGKHDESQEAVNAIDVKSATTIDTVPRKKRQRKK